MGGWTCCWMTKPRQPGRGLLKGISAGKGKHAEDDLNLPAERTVAERSGDEAGDGPAKPHPSATERN
jgi:hypothetical protein